MNTIRHLHRPISLLALALSLTLLNRGDTAAPVNSVIAFIGAFAQESDASYADFRSALRRVWPRDADAALRYYEAGDLDEARLRAAVAAAATLRPTVLVLPTGDSAAAARSMRIDTPSVFAAFSDPVRRGIVASMRRPGGRMTGIALGDSLDVKRLELLKDAFPTIVTVAMLTDRSWLANEDVGGVVEAAWRRLGLRVVVHVSDTADEFAALMQSPSLPPSDAWYIPPTYVADLAEREIIAAMARLQVPAIHTTDREVANGALMAYAQDSSFAYDAMAQLALRVALGEDAGTIPIQRPYRHTLSVRINPDAPWARIDPSVIRRADRVYRP